jgi:hypothetical protein
MNTGFDSFRRRGNSFSSSGVPPLVDSFRPGRDNSFNNLNNDYSYPEVSGPPNGPPPHLAFGHSSYSNIHNSVPPPSSMPQAFPPPPPGSMSASYPMGNSEQHSFHGYDSPPGFHPTGMPPPATGYPNSYDSSPLSDNQFPALVDEGGFGGRGRTLSTGGGGFGPPALVPSAPPMTPYPSHFGLPKRARRASSVGPGMGSGMGSGMGMGMGMGYVPSDMFHRPGGRIVVKFRLKGEGRSGITVNEALHRERLSQSQGYLMHDIAPDMSSRITLKVRVSCLTLLLGTVD